MVATVGEETVAVIVLRMTENALKDVMQRVETWPQEDQLALAEFAREIEARRTGVYRLTEEERAAIQKAREGELLPDHEMDEYWKRHDIS
jgi:hypothetical protein